MTQEEKARAYDEALEKAREHINSKGIGDTVDLCKHLFPELRESEDEKIRKKCIELIKRVIPSGDSHSQESKEILDCIAYLEKQKEQKPELVQHPPITYTYNSNASRDERLKAALLALLNSDLLKVKEGGYFTKQDLIEWVERIPTDKPADWNGATINGEPIPTENQSVNIPLAEWSEEDADILNCCISSIEEAKENRYAYKETDGDTSYDREIAWLKSLRPQTKDETYKEKDEAFKLGKHQLALSFMNYLDENRPEGKMSLSSGECEDIDKAFKENDWAKILRYAEKYGKYGK